MEVLLTPHRRPALLLAMVAVLAGCASSRPEPERERVFLTDASQYTWTGKTVDQVLQVFGAPSGRAPDGTGLTVLTYEEIKTPDETPEARIPQEPGHPGVARDPMEDPEARRRAAVTAKTQAQFWIDAEGVVTRFWFSPEMYRKGIPSPPGDSHL